MKDYKKAAAEATQKTSHYDAALADHGVYSLDNEVGKGQGIGDDQFSYDGMDYNGINDDANK